MSGTSKGSRWLIGSAILPLSMVAAAPAWADCLPNASGTIVNCNADDPDGFVAGDGVTINVNPGATVNGPLTVGTAGRINIEGIVGNPGPSAVTAGGGTFVANTRIATVNGSLSFGVTGTGVVNTLENRGQFNGPVSSAGALNLLNDFTGIEVGQIIGNISSTGPTTITNSGATALIQGNITLGDGNDTVTNSGIIQGNVALGTGTASLTNALGGQITGNISAGGNTVISNAGTFTGNISLGAGDDTISNTGAIVGNIDMGAGVNTIGFGSTAALPTGTLTAAPAGTNTVNLFGSGVDTLNIAVTNFDVLNKDGSGSWSLSQPVVLADRVNINAGTLITSDADWLAGNRVVNNANLTFSNLADGDFTGGIEGTGAVNVGGGGTAITTFSGANTYTGVTTVSGGTLRLAGGAALVDSGSVVVTAPGVLDVSAAETIGDLAGTGSVTLSGGNLSLGSGNFTGVISGANGLVKIGTGSLTLAGANTFAGPLTVSNGTVVLSGGAAVADTTAVVVNAAAGPPATSGTLQVSAAETIGSLAGSGGSVVLGAALTTGGSNASTAYAGVISGTGSLTKEGTGTFTLTGANSYSGGTIVNAGTLSGAAGPLQGAFLVNAAGTLQFDQPTDASFAGALSGAGTVAKVGAGVLTLTGTNTGHTGLLAVNGGTVSIGSAANVGTGVISLTGTTLATTGALSLGNAITLIAPGGTINTGAATTLSGVISGAGSLTKTGTATLTLTGANLYSGGTVIAAGTLAGAVGPIQGNVIINTDATLRFDQPVDAAFAGSILGAGTLQKEGAGVLTLSGTNSAHTGVTNINGGAVSIAAASNIGTGAINLNGSTLITTGPLTLANAIGLGGTGGTFNAQSNTNLSGIISGSGGFTSIGTAVLTLSGANTYTGVTTVSGGTLRLAGGAALVDSGSVVVTAPGVLDVSAAETIGDLAGTGSVTLSGGNLSLGSGNFTGVISGANGLVKIGTGSLTLAGANTFAGPLTVSNGTVVLSGGAAVADTTAVVVNAAAGPPATSGTLQVSAAETIGSLAGSGGSVVLGAALTTGGSNASTAYAGVISGTGSLTKEGTGTFTLTGANSYSGGTVVNAGTLSGAAGPLQGAFLVNAGGTLQFDQVADASFAGALSGAGTVAKAGAGVLTLTGTNTGHTGTLAINGGSVSIASAANIGTGVISLTGTTLTTTGALSLANAITLNAPGGTINTGAATTLSGVLSGAGSLTKAGTATLTLTGANSYTGGTVIAAGTLVGNSTSLQGAISNSGALVFDETAGGTFAGVISGTGTVTKQGAGTLTLTGTNSYTGATAINAGTLVVGPSSISDASAVTIGTGATLQLAASETIGSLAGAGALDTAGFTLTAGGNNSSTTFSGAATGTGLTKAGTGTLTLSGTGTLSGALTAAGGGLTIASTGAYTAGSAVASAGTFTVGGALTAPVTVASGATYDVLTGGTSTGTVSGAAGSTIRVNGTIAGDVTNAGTLTGAGVINGALVSSGALRPGNSPGILTVNGAFSQTATGVLNAELTTAATPGTGYDQVNVVGTAALAGTLALAPATGLYTAGSVYDVVVATGGITGDFTSITGNVLSPFLSFADTGVVTLAGTQQAYRLTVARVSYATGLGSGATPNQIAVANGFQGMVAGATGDAATVVTAVDNMTADQAAAFFDQSSPEFYGAFATALQDQASLYMSQIDRRIDERGQEAPFALWVNLYGQWAKGSGGDTTFGTNRDLWGLVGGADYSSGDFVAGLAVGYSSADLTYRLGTADGGSDSLQIAGYAAYTGGGFDFRAKIGYADGNFDATRSITAGTIGRTAQADFDGSLFMLSVEGGYDLGNDDWNIRPFAGVEVLSGKVNSFTETGSGSIALSVDRIKTDLTRLRGGVDISKEAGNVTPYLRAVYAYQIAGDRDVSAVFAGAPNSRFTVDTREPGDSMVELDAGVQYRFSEKAAAFVGYQGRYRSDISSHGGNVGVRFNF
jgi:autotransporter-associated beta strand protein